MAARAVGSDTRGQSKKNSVQPEARVQGMVQLLTLITVPKRPFGASARGDHDLDLTTVHCSRFRFFGWREEAFRRWTCLDRVSAWFDDEPRRGSQQSSTKYIPRLLSACRTCGVNVSLCLPQSCRLGQRMHASLVAVSTNRLSEWRYDNVLFRDRGHVSWLSSAYA